jgi:hypothetical protein
MDSFLATNFLVFLARRRSFFIGCNGALYPRRFVGLQQSLTTAPTERWEIFLAA